MYLCSLQIKGDTNKKKCISLAFDFLFVFLPIFFVSPLQLFIFSRFLSFPVVFINLHIKFFQYPLYPPPPQISLSYFSAPSTENSLSLFFPLFHSFSHRVFLFVAMFKPMRSLFLVFCFLEQFQFVWAISTVSSINSIESHKYVIH
jgi:hypothetical protein